ncbi:MAG TPA: hypothetical protein VGJ60_27210 [Chloroflexota bacterium]
MTEVATGAHAAVAAPQLDRQSQPRFGFERVRELLVFNPLYFGVAVLAGGYAFTNPASQSEL